MAKKEQLKQRLVDLPAPLVAKANDAMNWDPLLLIKLGLHGRLYLLYR